MHRTRHQANQDVSGETRVGRIDIGHPSNRRDETNYQCVVSIRETNGCAGLSTGYRKGLGELEHGL